MTPPDPGKRSMATGIVWLLGAPDGRGLTLHELVMALGRGRPAISRELQKLRRAGRIAYDRAAKKWRNTR